MWQHRRCRSGSWGCRPSCQPEGWQAAHGAHTPASCRPQQAAPCAPSLSCSPPPPTHPPTSEPHLPGGLRLRRVLRRHRAVPHGGRQGAPGAPAGRRAAQRLLPPVCRRLPPVGRRLASAGGMQACCGGTQASHAPALPRGPRQPFRPAPPIIVPTGQGADGARLRARPGRRPAQVCAAGGRWRPVQGPDPAVGPPDPVHHDEVRCVGGAGTGCTVLAVVLQPGLAVCAARRAAGLLSRRRRGAALGSRAAAARARASPDLHQPAAPPAPAPQARLRTWCRRCTSTWCPSPRPSAPSPSSWRCRSRRATSPASSARWCAAPARGAACRTCRGCRLVAGHVLRASRARLLPPPAAGRRVLLPLLHCPPRS